MRCEVAKERQKTKNSVGYFLKRAFSLPAVIVVVAFCVRMGLLLYSQTSLPTLRFDHLPIGYEVGRVAHAIAAGKGFSSPLDIDTGPTAWFTPIYPYLLAAVFKLFGIYTYTAALVILTLNSAFSAFVCWPILNAGRKTFSPSVGVWSAWLWVFLPTGVFFPVYWIWDTTLLALLLSLIFWATLTIRDSTRVWAWLGYGALWALGALTNPAVLLLLPFLFGWLAVHAKRKSRRCVRLVGAAAVTFMIGVTPWLVRNYLTFGQFVFFRSNFGLELYLGNNEHVPDSWSWWLHPNDNAEEREKFRRMGEMAYMAEKQRLAVRFITTHPGEFARFTFHRFVNNWTGAWEPIADVWPRVPLHVRAIYVTNSAFSVLALLGLFLALHMHKPEALAYAIVLLVFPVLYYISHTSLRYRHPIDPLMTVLAVYAVSYSLSRLAQRRTFPAPRVASRAAAPEQAR